MAIDFFLHVVPGGTVGIGPQPNGTPYELIVGRANNILQLDWAIYASAPITLTTEADIALGIVGWRVNLPAGGVLADRLGGVGIFGEISGGVYISGPHFPPMGSLFSGAAVGAAAELFGYYFMETEVLITQAVINSLADDFAFHVSPSWCSGSSTEHFQGTNGFGVVWSARLNSPNWHLYITNADTNDNYFALVDTGISALDGVIRNIRVEWGYDLVIAKPVIRALIDGVVKAELVGPFTLDSAFDLGGFSQGASVGLDICDTQGALSAFNAFFGMASGIRIGGFLVTPPSPPIPPVVTIDNCTIGVPIFTDETNGSIQTFQPCSGTGSGTQGGSACG